MLKAKLLICLPVFPVSPKTPFFVSLLKSPHIPFSSLGNNTSFIWYFSSKILWNICVTKIIQQFVGQEVPRPASRCVYVVYCVNGNNFSWRHDSEFCRWPRSIGVVDTTRCRGEPFVNMCWRARQGRRMDIWILTCTCCNMTTPSVDSSSRQEKNKTSAKLSEYVRTSFWFSYLLR